MIRKLFGLASLALATSAAMAALVYSRLIEPLWPSGFDALRTAFDHPRSIFETRRAGLA